MGRTKVSVVVAVYNPGPNIDGLVASLDGQSLGPDELEVVFVDDGSTDGTHERLLEVARSRPNVVLATIPNSGWPGRPRNVGTDLAHGDYVFYADHDDEFFPQALERMYALAAAERSDVVYGKVVRIGRPTPYWSLARRNLPKADATLALDSLTVHKLFRREFLIEHQIRFPEGRVRLEDHNFMAQALPRAEVISVLADYPCYRWIHRRDGSNSSTAKIDKHTYWGYYAGVLRTMEANAGAGPLLDAARVTRMVAAFTRIPSKNYLQRNPADRADSFEALHGVVLEQFPARLDEKLPVLKRLRVQAMRSGEMSRFDQLQRNRAQISFTFEGTQVSWDAGRLLVGLESSMVSAQGHPLGLDQIGDDVALPVELGAPSGPTAAPCVLSKTEQGAGEITVRHRVSGVEWPVDSSARPMTRLGGQRATLSVQVDGIVDPAAGAFGRELETGIWDVLARVQFLGEHQLRKIPISEAVLADCPDGCLRQVGDRKVLAYRTQSSTLALKISPAVAPPSVAVLTARWDSGDLVVAVDLGSVGRGATLVVRRRGVPGEQRVRVHEGQARIALWPSARGDIFDFWLRTSAGTDGSQDQRLAFGAAEVSQRPPYRIYPTIHGSFSVKNVGAAPPPDAPAPRARKWFSRKG